MNAIDERDEIGELVEKCSVNGIGVLEQSERLGELLPVERPSAVWPVSLADRIDRELAQEFPLLDLESVQGTLHAQKFGGIVAPRFATYIESRSGEFSLQVQLQRLGETVGVSTGQHFLAVVKYQQSVRADYYRPAEQWGNRACVAAIGLCMAGLTAICASTGDWYWMFFAPLSLLLSVLVFGVVYTAMATNKTVTLNAKFSGIIPKVVRQTINTNRPRFDQILLVQEVAEWNAIVERPVDPLVVGIKNGVAYLIDRFDTTTFEEYVAREFSQDAK